MRPTEHYDPNAQIRGNHFGALLKLAKYLWPQGRVDLKVRVVLSMLALILVKLTSAAVPVIYKNIIDYFSSTEMKGQVVALPLLLLLGLALAKVVQSIFGELRDLLFVRVGQHSQRTLALAAFKHLHSMSLSFHLGRQTGGLSRVIDRAIRGIQFILTFMLFNILPTLFEIILVTGLLTYYFDFRYGLIALGSVVIFVTFTFVITEWRLKHRRKMNEKDSKANSRAIDSLLNFETVKYFNNEQYEYDRYDHFLREYEEAAIANQGSLSALNVGQAFIVSLGIFAILYMAGTAFVTGKHTLGEFVMAHTYLMQLFIPLNFLGFVYREMKQSFVDMDKLFELMEEATEFDEKESLPDFVPQGGSIEFKNVSFSYNPDRAILKNVSFKIGAGKKVAIVGPSGSGKSTLGRLLFRFYEPSSGEVIIDGQNINATSPQSVRRSIGVVPQDTVLFNDTIGFNIAYGNPQASESEIKQAAKMAQIEEFIESQSLKYDTLVGERGLKLSGGEKQRVAIARAFLKNPQTLLFDEATSALDSKTEQEIQASFREVAKGRSSMIIAHRLSTIIDSDEIVVLKEGEVVEKGTHSELLAKKQEYASMWERQLEAQTYQKKLESCLSEPKGEEACSYQS